MSTWASEAGPCAPPLLAVQAASAHSASPAEAQMMCNGQRKRTALPVPTASPLAPPTHLPSAAASSAQTRPARRCRPAAPAAAHWTRPPPAPSARPPRRPPPRPRRAAPAPAALPQLPRCAWPPSGRPSARGWHPAVGCHPPRPTRRQQGRGRPRPSHLQSQGVGRSGVKD